MLVLLRATRQLFALLLLQKIVKFYYALIFYELYTLANIIMLIEILTQIIKNYHFQHLPIAPHTFCENTLTDQLTTTPALHALNFLLVLFGVFHLNQTNSLQLSKRPLCTTLFTHFSQNANNLLMKIQQKMSLQRHR